MIRIHRPGLQWTVGTELHVLPQYRGNNSLREASYLVHDSVDMSPILSKTLTIRNSIHPDTPMLDVLDHVHLFG